MHVNDTIQLSHREGKASKSYAEAENDCHSRRIRMRVMRVLEENCYFLPVLFSVLEGREDLAREDESERAL